MANADNILEISELAVSYHDGGMALRGVNLCLQAGQRVALVGPNGSGKTTLMLAIMRGLPFSGRVVVDGIESSRRTADEIRSRCGMMFQEADDQLFMPTLLDDVAFGPLNQLQDAAAAEARARLAIEQVGLAGLEGRCAHHLSGGQKRCAALATILSMQVKLLLLDEPGANLDFRSRKNLLALLSARSEAMLLASHDLDLVRQLCRYVVILDAGQVAASGPAEEILSNQLLLQRHGLA